MRLVILNVAVMVQGIACLRLFDSKEQLPANMTGECKDALTRDVGCSPRLIMPGEVARRLPSNTEELDQYCGDSCVQSMKASLALPVLLV